MEEIIAVILVWILILIVSSRLLGSRLFRWELVLGTILVAAWVIWAIQYRLEQAQQERYQRRR
jgi:hypothetical protein